MTKRDFHIRIGVKNDADQKSAVWRIWTAKAPKYDIYIAARNIAGEFKVSLHETGDWRAAITKQYAEKLFDDSVNIPNERILDKWERPKALTKDLTLAYRIIVPNSDLEEGPSYTKKIEWIAPKFENNNTEILLFLTKPTYKSEDWPGKKLGAKLVANYKLANNETLWIVYINIEMSKKFETTLKQMRKNLVKSLPKRIQLKNLIKSGRPRIIYGTNDSKEVANAFDLSFKKTFSVASYLKLIFKSLVNRIK